MNILFLSRLSDNNNCGPFYSVPRQVAAQREFDQIFWLNANKVLVDEWAEIGQVKTEWDYPNPRLADLPAPFQHPDIVVVEEQYNFVRMPLMQDVQKAGIPYVLVPRCSLTASAQKKKAWKKILGNLAYFNRFIKRAAGIQFLTEQEKNESGAHWNANGFVIPNGIVMPEIEKTYHLDQIVCTFIGRIDIYHKGLDMLLRVCTELADEMVAAGMHIDIFGAGLEDDVAAMRAAIVKCKGTVTYRGPVHGKEKEQVLLETDVFLLTSRFEGMPMGLLEAMSYGIPAMITKGTNMVPVIEEFECGWTGNNTEDDIKIMIRSVIKQKKEIPAKGRRSAEAARIYDWHSIAKATHDILGEIVRGQQ